MRQLLSDNFSRTVSEGERILKLLGESPATNRRDIQEQTVLRIIKFQAGAQLGLFVNPLANHPRRQHGRPDVSWLIPHQAAIRTGDDTLAAIRSSFRQHRKDALRRQSLFDVQARDDRAKLIVERYSHQAVSQSATPNLLARTISHYHHGASVDAGDDLLQLATLKYVEPLIRRQPSVIAVVRNRPDTETFQLVESVVRCSARAVKYKSTGAGRSDDETSISVCTQTHDFAPMLVGACFGPHQRTPRALELLNPIAERGDIDRATVDRNRAYTVTLCRSVFDSRAHKNCVACR